MTSSSIYSHICDCICFYQHSSAINTFHPKKKVQLQKRPYPVTGEINYSCFTIVQFLHRSAIFYPARYHYKTCSRPLVYNCNTYQTNQSHLGGHLGVVQPPSGPIRTSVVHLTMQSGKRRGFVNTSSPFNYWLEDGQMIRLWTQAP